MYSLSTTQHSVLVLSRLYLYSVLCTCTQYPILIILKVVARYGGSDLFSQELEARTAGKQAIDAARLIVSECFLPLSPQQFLAEMDDEIRPLLSSASLKPGVQRLVDHLADHNVPVAIATSSRQSNSKLKMSGHPDLFNKFNHKVFGSDDPEVARGKPNPDIFLVAASRFPDPPISPGNINQIFVDNL